MMSINPNEIRPGDTVRVEFWDDDMKDYGAPPVESQGIVYPDRDGDLCVGAVVLDDSDAYTILEHTPTPEKWADALAVRTGEGELFGQIDTDYFVRLGGGVGWRSRSLEECRGPITVVIDAEGDVVCEHAFAVNHDGSAELTSSGTLTVPRELADSVRAMRIFDELSAKAPRIVVEGEE